MFEGSSHMKLSEAVFRPDALIVNLFSWVQESNLGLARAFACDTESPMQFAGL